MTSIIERQQSHNKSKSLSDINHITINFQLEYLDKCQFNCKGCYVKRRNSYSSEDLEKIISLSKSFNDSDIELNEIILGPTDIFGSSNTLEIIQNPLFKKLFDHFKALTFNSTLLSSDDNILQIMNVINTEYDNLQYIEMFVVLDIEQIDDRDYINTLKHKLSLLGNINIIFVCNIHLIFLNYDFAYITKIINEEFDSHVKFNPSFFRSQNTKIINKELIEFNNLMDNIDNTSKILININDIYFGGHTYFTYIFEDSNMYISPYLFDYIFVKNDKFKIDDITLDKVFEKDTQLTIDQYRYSELTDECKDCQFLSSCVSKKILMYMETKDITNCILPKKMMNLYNNYGINS